MTHRFVIPNENFQEFPTAERCFITELLNHPLSAGGVFGNGRASMPGVTTANDMRSTSRRLT